MQNLECAPHANGFLLIKDTLKQTAAQNVGFAHYGARYVYGDKAYRYAITQNPWFDKKMSDYAYKLSQEIGV